ncbi:MAG: DUF6036 family nucleotidyltransferase [Lentihominibacter sp.]|jgi:hypothetical protein
MSSKDTITFTKNNLDTYLKELAKEYKKLGGKRIPAEIILIGGASVLTNYGFREMTTDVDALIQAASIMKDAINHVGDRYKLPVRWLNEDFKRTASYSPKLVRYSTHYKSFYGVLEVRTITAEHLIAMKLMSGRQYKNDLSDIIDIMAEHQKAGKDISMEEIRNAAADLYGAWDVIPSISQTFIEDVIQNGDYVTMQLEVSVEEQEAKKELLEFENEYQGVTNKANINDIIAQLKKKQK